MASTTRFEKSFAEAMKMAAKNAETIPDDLYEAIIDKLAVEDRNAVPQCLPNGPCNIPIGLQPIWDYGCHCLFG